MSCNFSVPFTGSADAILARAKKAVTGQGGTFNGDNNQGDFEVSVFGSTIKGSYNVSEENLIINISSKPFFIPCSTVESYLKKEIG